jgi:uncharacterized membrane protein YfcA
MLEIAQYIIGGAAVGLAIGITGVGGGSLMTPLLILLGIPYNIAIGTDLLYASITKAGGVYSHQKRGTIRWRIVFYMGAGSIPAALLTAWVLHHFFGNANNYGPLLTHTLGIMLIITSLVIFFRKRLQQKSQANSKDQANWAQRNAGKVVLAVGLLLGSMVTLSSVGAGAFGTAVLLVLFPRLPALNIVGTDLAHAVPLTFIAGMGHLLLLGNVDFSLLISLLIGSLPAVHLGTRIGARMPNQILQPILASILMLLGVKFAFF